MRSKASPLTALGAFRWKKLASLALIVGFAFWAHLGSGIPVFKSHVVPEPGWEAFRAEYRVDYFGDDGQFVRAVQNGYNLFHHTHAYAPRFTRRTAPDKVEACASCHSVADLAYGFVNSDRHDPRRERRLSFEDRVRSCYAVAMNGFVPTIYDPAVRDLRLLARAVARHLGLGEGARRSDP